MNIQVEGTITKVLPIKFIQKKDGSTAQSQDFILTDLGARYEESIAFTVFGEDKLSLLAPKLAQGAKVTVHLAPSARTSVNQTTGEERAYCSLHAWRVDNPAYDAQTAQLAAQLPPQQPQYAQAAPQPHAGQVQGSTLPPAGQPIQMTPAPMPQQGTTGDIPF